jgi:hypothetical protein
VAGLWKFPLQQVTVQDLKYLPCRKINEQKMHISTMFSNNVHGKY